MTFESFFAKKKMNPEKLCAFGFSFGDGTFSYSKPIHSGEFDLTVRITKNTVNTSLLDVQTGEEYALYKTAASGTFVGEIRAEIADVLQTVADSCFEQDIFTQPQTLRIIEFVRKKFGDELEFLWKKFDDNAVWRRKDSRLWYAAVLTVQKKKICGVSSVSDDGKTVEILDLRIQAEKMESLLAMPHFYPGYHMNKKTWFTVILDDTVSDLEIQTRIENSYALAVKRR